MSKKSVPKIVFSNIIGLLIFLILLAIANILVPFIPSQGYPTIIAFLNQNLLFLVMISFISLFSELFFALMFPFNLPAPIFAAVQGVMITVFVYRALGLADMLAGLSLSWSLRPVVVMLCFMVFFIVIIVGYIKIFSALVCPDKRPKKVKPNKKRSSKVSWDDIGEEFKLAFLNLGSLMKESLEKARKDMKKRSTR